MKKILMCLMLSLFLFETIEAQIKLTFDENALRPGDIHKTQLADFTEIGPSGSNVVWDFSKLQCRGGHTGSTMRADETPFANSFPEANIAVTENGNYFYFNVQKEFSEQCGWTTNNVVVRYDPPMRKYNFPFHYKDSLSGQFGGGTSFSILNGVYTSKIDGFGTLKLPNVTIKNVIRLKSTEKFIEVSCNSIEVFMTKYLYYSNDFRYPLATIVVRNEKTSDGKTFDKKYILYNDNLPATLARNDGKEAKDPNLKSSNFDNDGEIEYKVFPNPITDQGNVSYSIPDKRLVEIEIINEDGRVMSVLSNEEQEAGTYTKTFSPEKIGLKNAAFFVKMMFGNKVYLAPIILQRN